jgi:hypothetical protein
MKNQLLLLIILISARCLQAQICSDQGTSTNPDSPSSPTAPLPNPEHWLNTFNWYDNDGSSLINFAIYDLFTYSDNQTSMPNPYSQDIGVYSHLTNVPLELKDFHPENGWELLSVNLGAYPNGEVLTDHPPLQSNFSQTPYLLLYSRLEKSIRTE